MTSSDSRRYGFALVATVTALFLKQGLGSAVVPGTFAPGFMAVMLSAWLGGFGPGLLATLIYAAVACAWLIPGEPTVGALPVALRVAFFLGSGAFVSWGAARIQELRHQLERGVEERTAELSEANRSLRAEMMQRQQAEERFRSAFEHAPIGMALVGLDGRPLRVNRALYQMLGYTEEEFLNLPVWEVTHPDDMQVTIEQLQRMVCGEIEQWELEKRFFHKNGSIVWGFSTSSLIRDADGTALYVVSQLQDITARKQIEAQLMLQAQVLDSMVEGVNLSDADGIIRFANPAMEKLFGYAPGELVGVHVSALNAYSREESAALVASVINGVRAEGSFAGEFRNRKKDGTECITSARVSALEMGGKRHWLSLQHDITKRHRAEAALRQERNFVSAVVETVGALVGVVDRDGYIVRFNRACEQTLGWTAAEVIGRPFWDLLPIAEEVGRARAVFEKLLAGEWPQEYETYWFRRDGTPCSLTWSTSFLRDEHGAVQYVIGSGIDITARKQAEAALRASEERFQHAFKSAPIGMTLVGLDSMPLQVNSAMSDILGYSEEELLRIPVPEITDPSDMEQAYRDRARLLSGEVRSYQAERRYFHKSGRVVWAELNVSLVRAPDGAPLYLVTQMQDITARKQAEDALRDSEERFQSAFEYAPIGIALVGLDLRVLQVNRALCDLLGYNERDLLSRSLADLIHADEASAAVESAKRLLSGEVRSYRAERRYVQRSGQVIRVQVSVSLVHDREGKPAYYVFQFEDITQRKLAEEMLRSAREQLEMRVAQRTAELARVNLRLQEQIVERRGIEDELRRGKEFSERLINSSVDGIFAVDRECRYTVWNQGMERIVGFSAAEVLGKGAFDLFPFLNEIGQRQVFEQVLRGHPVTASVRPYLRPKTGQRGFFEGYYSPLPNEAGETVGVLGIVRDVTAREQAEQRLREAEARYRNLLESMLSGFFAVDNEFRFTYVNRAGEQIVQQPREALLGRNAWEVFPEAVGSEFFKQREEIKAGQRPVDVEFYFPPQHRWFSVHMYPTPDGISALFEDITERHTREVNAVSDILRALNARLDVSEAFPSVASSLRLLTDCERAALGLFDHAGEWVTVLALDRAEGQTEPGIRIRMSEFPGVRTVLAGDAHVVHDLAADGGSALVERVRGAGFHSAVGLPLRGTSEVLGMLILVWRERGAGNKTQLPLLGQIADAVALAVEKNRLFDEVRTSRERLQALSRRLLEVQEAERRHLARELHDEVGQHLTGLKLLLDSLEHLPAASTVGRLREAHQLIEDLVGRVRELSLDLRPAMLDDLGLLPSLLWLFDRYNTQTALRVHFEHQGLEQRFPQEVETAAYRIVQEALTNVARYAGVPEVTVHAHAQRRVLTLQVSDQGSGFDSDRALATARTSGLAGMRERALLLGGRLEVESAPGAGTRLRAQLPLGDKPTRRKSASGALG